MFISKINITTTQSRKKGNKNKYISILRDYASPNYSLIMYETSNRINFFLNIMDKNFENYKIALVKELSKMYEEVFFITSDNIKNFIKNFFALFI